MVVSANAQVISQKNNKLSSTEISSVSIAKLSSTNDKQLLIDSLENADFQQIEYYIALFSKYSNEDINSLTANEILDYIDLYGSFTNKDLIAELGLQEAKDNIDSFSDLSNFEDILYEAEDYYGYTDGEDASDTTNSDNINENSNNNKTNNNNNTNKNNKENNNSNDNAELDQKNVNNQNTNNKHKNWGDNKKLQVDNFSYDNDMISQFKSFFTQYYLEYLNGNLSIQNILDSIMGVNNKENNNDNNKQENVRDNNDNLNLNKSNVNNTNNSSLDNIVNKYNQNENSNINSSSSKINKNSSSNSTSSTADSTNILLILPGLVGLFSTIKKHK